MGSVGQDGAGSRGGTSRVALGSAQAFSPAVCGVAGPCGRFAVVGCQGPCITPVPLIILFVLYYDREPTLAHPEC